MEQGLPAIETIKDRPQQKVPKRGGYEKRVAGLAKAREAKKAKRQVSVQLPPIQSIPVTAQAEIAQKTEIQVMKRQQDESNATKSGTIAENTVLLQSIQDLHGKIESLQGMLKPPTPTLMPTEVGKTQASSIAKSHSPRGFAKLVNTPFLFH